MVGGDAHIETQQERLNTSDITSWNINVSPNIGYFFANKLAGGLKLTLAYTVLKYSGIRNEATILKIGPFIRYYFLSTENQVNIFAESAYQRQTDFKGFRMYNFSLSAGPVIYFNSSVGLELTLNYEQYRGKSSTPSAKTFSFGIGFQIHLEKEKKF